MLAKKNNEFLGLDIGSRYVKALLLSQKGKEILLEGIACEPIYGDSFQEREIKDFDAVNHALKKIKKSIKASTKNVVMAVSGSTVLTKNVDMESGLSDIDLEAQIEIEADSLIPYPINEVYIDFEELGPHATKTGRSDVLLSVAHKNIIENRTLLSREAEYEVKIMDIEGYALGNAMIQFGNFTPEERNLCINIGANQLQMTVIENNQILMSRELGFGTDNLVSEIALNYGINKNEVFKGILTDDLPDGWRDIVYPQFLSSLQMQINRILQLYISTYSADEPKQLFVCGGALGIQGLVDDLSMDMQIDLQVFDPLAELELGKQITREKFQGAQFAIVAGLAFRSFSACHT